MKSSSGSIGVDKWPYWLTDQENLSPSGISKMWKSRKILLCPIFRDITWKNLLTFHHLAVDPLRVLTGEGHDFLRIVEVLLWYSLPNSAEEHSRIAVDLEDATAGLSFLCPFLAYDRRKTLNLR